MNAEQLRDAIGKIDERFLEEAEHYEPETVSIKPIWLITSASAAVIALCTGIHFHNATEHALRPEIDNSVVITTTVSETETYETDVVKTEKQVQILEPVTENTEATGMKSGEEGSIPYVAAVPVKTEAPSGNGSSSDEKTEVTERPYDVTSSENRYTEQIPVVQPTPTFEYTETEPSVITELPTVNPTIEIPVPTSPADVTMVTEEPHSSVVSNPDYVPQLNFMEIKSAIETIQENDVSVYSGKNREAFCEVHDRLLTDGKFFVQTAEKPIDAEKNSSVNILTRTEKNDICIEYNLYYKNKVFIVQFCYADKETAGNSSDLSDYLSRRLNMETDSYISVKDYAFLIEREKRDPVKNIYSALDDYHYMRISTAADENDLIGFFEAFSFETTEIHDLSNNSNESAFK